jgi:hypothetical protein
MNQTPTTQTTTSAFSQGNVVELEELVSLLKPGMAVRGLFGENVRHRVTIGRLNEEQALDDVYRFNSILVNAYGSKDDLEMKMQTSRYQLQALTKPEESNEIWYRVK